jgi:hypothetical protein
MKTTAEYFDLATQFDLFAVYEEDPKLKADFQKQAGAYRRLAETRLGKSDSETPKISN